MAPRLLNSPSDNHATHPAKGREVQYVVKVSILGLAGITVDRPKCRDHSYSKHAPAPPSDMTAIVSILHDSQSQGSTPPSNALKRSPQDGVIIRARCADGQEEVVDVPTSGLEKRRQRHVAVWNYDEDSQDTSIVFHTKLLRLDEDAAQTAASSALARKHFKLIVGLVDNVSDTETKYALPVGAANLAISADHPNGLVAIMDLPVYPLAFSPKSSTNYVAIPADTDAGEKKKKKRGLARVFSRKQAVEPKEEPVVHVSDAEKEDFCSAYAVDLNGDALLRVEVEVWEKGMAPSVVSRASTKASKRSKTSRLSRSTRGSKTSKTSSSPAPALSYILPLTKRMNSSPSVQIAKARPQLGFADSESPIHPPKPPEIRRVQSADHVEAKMPKTAPPTRSKSPTLAPSIDDLIFPPEAINSVLPTQPMEESIERVLSVDDSVRVTDFPSKTSDSPKKAMAHVAPKKTAMSKIASVAKTAANSSPNVKAKMESKTKSAANSSPKSVAKTSTVTPVIASSSPQNATKSSKASQGNLYSKPAVNPKPVSSSKRNLNLPWKSKSEPLGVSADNMISRAKKQASKAAEHAETDETKKTKVFVPPVPPVDPSIFKANARFNKDNTVQNEAKAPQTHEEDPPTGCSPGMTMWHIFEILHRPMCGTAQETGDSPSLGDGHSFASLDLIGHLRVPGCGTGRGGDDEASWLQEHDEVFREGLCRPESFNSIESDNITNRIARWKMHLRTLRANDVPFDEHSLTTYEDENTLMGSKGDTFDGTMASKNSHDDDTLEETLEGSTIEGTLENALEGTLEGTLEDTLEGTLEGTLEDTLESTLDGTLKDTLEGTLEDTVDQSQYFEELFSLDSDQFLTAGKGPTTVSNDKTPVHGQPAPEADEPLVTPPKIERTAPLSGPRKETLKLFRQSEDESPRGVSDLPYASGNENSKPTLSQTLFGFISCRTTLSREDIFDHPPSTGLTRDVPDLVSRPGDESSIGDLTATTHEMRVDIETYKQSLLASKDAWKKKPNPTTHKVTDLFKFGARPTKASEETPSELESESEKREDYFKEYDDFSFLSPEMAAAAEAAWAHKKANV